LFNTQDKTDKNICDKHTYFSFKHIFFQAHIFLRSLSLKLIAAESALIVFFPALKSPLIEAKE